LIRMMKVVAMALVAYTLSSLNTWDDSDTFYKPNGF